MATYQTEEEQVEALKKWWQENGTSVIAGLVLGFLIIGGGKAWLEYNRVQAENASLQFENFMQAAEDNDLETAVQRGSALIQTYENSVYAQFTALELAKLQYQAGDKEKAKRRLQWVEAQAKDEAIQQLARIRLARLLLDMNQIEQAAQLVQSIADNAYQGEFLAIKAEIALSQGDKEKAKQALSQALDKGVSQSELIKMQLAELGG